VGRHLRLGSRRLDLFLVGLAHGESSLSRTPPLSLRTPRQFHPFSRRFGERNLAVAGSSAQEALDAHHHGQSSNTKPGRHDR